MAVITGFLWKIFKFKPAIELKTLDYANCDKIWDNTKLKATGFEFKYPHMEKGMKETLQWYKDHGWFKA